MINHLKRTDRWNQRKENKNKWKKGIKISLLSFLVLSLLLGGYLFYTFNQFGSSIFRNAQGEKPEQTLENDFGISDLFTNTFDRPLNVLVLGVDAREDQSFEGARSDTIMVMRIDPKTKQVATVSFPRDTYVRIPKYGYQKINHSMAYGGIPLLEATIEENFGITIDNYIAIDFVAFTEIVDALGGLEVYTPSSMYYIASDIQVELTPGYHHLNGEELLGYVRYRHDAEGDFGRIKRQQYVIRALAEKAVSAKTILKAPKLLDILGEHISTDLSKQDLFSIMKTYHSFSKKDWHPMTLSGTSGRSSRDNLWYYYYDEEDKQKVLEHLDKYSSVKQFE
ncbi:LCP family protein [Tepidibacillus infernus]|uniref:LCP family protein n=1 Tax=Tepidibacillus infernus TaxID=1806172 RepID=UPI003B6AB8F8